MDFLSSGLIMAFFKTGGTWPVWREWLIAAVIRGLRTVIWVFTREVGRGSRGQVEDFIFLMIFCTSSDETSGEQFRGWETVYVGGTVWVGGPERAERICAIFDVKKSRNLLHCSSVVVVSGEDCGLRRWFIVEKSCLEFPGLFLIASE